MSPKYNKDTSPALWLDRATATIAFFESDDGRAIDTDRLAEMQGGFWEMVDELQNALGPLIAWSATYQAMHKLEDLHPTHQEIIDNIQALLDRMGVK